LKAQKHSRNRNIWQMNKTLARAEASQYNPMDKNVSTDKTRKKFMDFAQQVARAAAEAASIRRNFLVDIHSKKEKITQNKQSNKWENLEQDPKWKIVSNLLQNDMDATSSAMKALDIQKEKIQLQEQCQPPTEKDSGNNDTSKDSELEKVNSFREAFEKIKICFHQEPRDKALTLICALYNKLNCNDTILEFNEMFVNFEENEHWIPKNFERLMKKKKARNFLQQAFEKNNFNVITKTTEQCLEIKKIANSARILFTILIQCKWVQIEVLCIWAIIMTQEVNQADIETSTVLNNNYSLDVFFNHGAVALKSDQDQQNGNSIVSLMDADICHQIKG
jgi:hypothetical protein